MLRRLAVEILLTAAIGAVLAMLGPFGTYEMPAALRFAYWIGFILLGYAIFRPVQTAARWLAEASQVPFWAAALGACAVAALPMTALVGFAIGGMRSDTPYWGPDFGPLYLQVLGIGIGVLAIVTLLFGERDRRPPVAEAPPRPKPLDVGALAQPQRPDAPFFDRLPAQLGHNLVCLEMQDHYVKAHTLSGSAMVLMRMRDAIAELDGIEGQQVHRSWWVAREWVRGVRREGRGLQLELANGLLAPVARSRQAELKRQGWL